MTDRDRRSSSEKVEIINLNSLTREGLSDLDPKTRDLVERRERVMGPAYRLTFQKPFQPARALGTRIIDVHGDEYLDAYNNVVSIGHNHPAVVEAITRQMTLINTNTRYLQEDVIEYAEDLVGTHDPEITGVMFTCTGSEANDLAMRIAREYTGGTGIIVSDYAYHGCTRDVASVSPSSGAGNFLDPHVRTVPPPDYFRNSGDLARAFTESVQAQIEDLKKYGIRLAALLIDPLFSSDGIYPDPTALRQVVKLVHAEGGLVISDEVQPGFARTGDAMWGYHRSGIVPDLATMGKPMGNGLPIAGVVGRKELMDHFGTKVAYFNTFGGENLPVAAAQATLNVIRDEDLAANSRDKGARLVSGVRDVLARRGVPSDVRGAGLYIGVEFVKDLDTKDPDGETSLAVVNGLRDRKIITSSAGPYGHVLKVRPPLVFSDTDLDRFLTEFDRTLGDLPGSASAASRGPRIGSQDELRRLIVEELRGLIGGSDG